MKKHKTVLLLFTLLFSLLLFGCNNKSTATTKKNNTSNSSVTKSSSDKTNSSDKTTNKTTEKSTNQTENTTKNTVKMYIVKFVDYNGEVLYQTTSVLVEMVTYPYILPTRESDEQYSYTFDDWNKTIDESLSLITYTAEYKRTEITYIINFDLNNGTSPSYVESRTVTSIDKNDFVFDCSKEGYNFRGWTYNGTLVFDENGNLKNNVQLRNGMTFVASYNDRVNLSIVKSVNDGGAITGAGEYAFNTEVNVKATPNEGYEFVGWYVGSTLVSNSKEYNYQMWNKDIVLTARFELKRYKLSVQSSNVELGEVVINPSYQSNYRENMELNITYTDEVTISANTKTNILFLGWFDEKDELVVTNAVYTFRMPHSDYKLTAKWNYFTIEYILNGGENNASNPTSYSVGSSNITLLNPTNTSGVEFLYWTMNGKRIEEINTQLSKNIVIEAMWSNSRYNISYNLNGGTASNSSYYNVSSGYTLNNPTRQGYKFIGWTGSNGDTPELSVYIALGSIGDKTYTANWEEIINYSISYNLDGGTCTNPFIFNDTQSDFVLNNPTKTGYNFIGWTGSNGETPELSVTIETNEHNNLSFTANYEIITYHISYRLNGGTLSDGENNPTEYTVEDSNIYLYSPSLKGYSFGGWIDNSNNVIEVIDTSNPKDYSLFARFNLIEYTISYVLDNGDATNPTKYTVNTDDIVLTDATRVGYDFVGWTSDTILEPIKNVTIQKGTIGNLSFTANYIAKSHTISFNSKGGSNVQSITQDYGTEITEPKKPTRTEYSFRGWFKDEDYNQPYTFTTMPDEDILLYAKWVDYEVTITTESIDGLSVHSDKLDPANYKATAIDTDGDAVEVVVNVTGGLFEAGGTINVRLKATGKYDIYGTKTISGVKVYGDPTITYNTSKDYINLSDLLDKSLFNISTKDSFDVELDALISIKEESYQGGDLVTVVISAKDVINNESTIEIPNIKVYGAPTITFDNTVTEMKVTDEITNEFFNVSAVDSFGESLTSTTVLYSGVKEGGNTITIKSSAIDSKGNSNYITYTVKVYGEPTILNPTKTAFKVEDNITLDSLGIISKDSFNVDLSNLSLELISGTQEAGIALTYRVTATDHLGNTATKEFNSIKIYGIPTITYDETKNKISDTDAINALLFGATAKDSFDNDLNVSIELYEGTITGGNIVKFKLTAVDAAGNTKEEMIENVRIYSLNDIEISYNSNVPLRIKKSSKGEEFSSSATDSFGGECIMSLIAEEGYAIEGGNTINLYILATDELGNTKRSETIESVKVYDMPVLTYARDNYWIQSGDDPYSLFSLKDSFGQDIEFSIETVSGSLLVNETIVYRITGTDRVNNNFNEIIELYVLAENESVLLAYHDDELVGIGRAVKGEKYTITTSEKGSCYLGRIKVTENDGNSLMVWDKDSDVYILRFTTQVEEEKERLGMIPVIDTADMTVTYGLYPQTHVSDSSLISELNKLKTPESNGWYLYQGNYYAKQVVQKSGLGKFDDGTTIVEGNTYWFLCESIVWDILSNHNGTYYLLSSVLLDTHCYYNSSSNRTINGKTIYPSNYEYSDIRSWLNNEFLNSAFALDSTYILTTDVDNCSETTVNQTYNPYTCNNTQDKIFLPSYQDYLNNNYGFDTTKSKSSTRICKTTEYVRSYSNVDNNGNYWTRTPINKDHVVRFDYNGEYYYSNVSIFNVVNKNCVRPCICIEI